MFSLLSERVLGPSGDIAPGRICIADGLVVEPIRGGREIDLGDALIAPGIVDLHGDAFERQIMPRPGVAFPMAMALRDTDQQMIASGITTAFHGLTWSWEPGLRSGTAARAFVAALEDERPHLACDTRLHLRHEAHTLEAVPEIIAWLAAGRIGLLAFNNHMDSMRRKAATRDVGKYAERAGISDAAFIALIHQVDEGDALVPAAIGQLAEAGRAAGVPMAAHDDYTPESFQYFHSLGCGIAEFPLNRPTADYARTLGAAVVMGSPNVMRGGSHTGGMNAGAMVKAGVVDVLTSDYYYPALLHAPFAMVASGQADLATAWHLVSRNPARTGGLTDRGHLAVGQRADVVVVDDRDPARPQVLATIAAGRMVYSRLGIL